MRGWRNPVSRAIYNGSWETLPRDSDRFVEDWAEGDSPVMARIERAGLLFDVRGEDVMLDRALGNALATFECEVPLGTVVWVDADGKRHTAEPDGHSRLVRNGKRKRPSRLIDDYEAIADEQRRWKNAYAAVRRALKSGALVRLTTCEKCGTTEGRIEAAHVDYSCPLDVVWLCQPCHRRWDAADPKTRAA